MKKFKYIVTTSLFVENQGYSYSEIVENGEIETSRPYPSEADLKEVIDFYKNEQINFNKSNESEWAEIEIEVYNIFDYPAIDDAVMIIKF